MICVERDLCELSHGGCFLFLTDLTDCTDLYCCICGNRWNQCDFLSRRMFLISHGFNRLHGFFFIHLCGSMGSVRNSLIDLSVWAGYSTVSHASLRISLQGFSGWGLNALRLLVGLRIWGSLNNNMITFLNSTFTKRFSLWLEYQYDFISLQQTGRRRGVPVVDVQCGETPHLLLQTRE